MEDQAFSLPQQALRILVRIASAVDDISERFTGMNDLQKILHFTASNTKRLLDEDNRDLWKKANLKGGFDIDAVTREVGILVWLSLSLGRAINQYRQVIHKKPINWEKYAQEIDNDERKAKHANPL